MNKINPSHATSLNVKVKWAGKHDMFLTRITTGIETYEVKQAEKTESQHWQKL